MKPSSRIKEIADKLVKEHGICDMCNTVHHPPTCETYWLDALVKYLDEEWEKKMRYLSS